MSNSKLTWCSFVNNVLPTLFIAICLSVIGGAWQTYEAVQVLTNKIAQHEKHIDELRSYVSQVEKNSVTQGQLLETLKRVELTLQLAVAQNGLKKTIKLVSGD